jgi:hypothetical protein
MGQHKIHTEKKKKKNKKERRWGAKDTMCCLVSKKTGSD